MALSIILSLLFGFIGALGLWASADALRRAIAAARAIHAELAVLKARAVVPLPCAAGRAAFA